MTYGVPYSFVPGTKARADEVNANFIDIINKLQETNTKLDETNTNLTTVTNTVNNSLANTSLSNLNSVGNAKFDGAWVSKKMSVVANKSISSDETQSFSISNYLPDSTNLYEIIASITVNTTNTSNSSAFLYIKTNCMESWIPIARCATRTNAHGYDQGQTLILSHTSRKIYINNTGTAVNASLYTLELHAYRKVR